MAFPPWLTVGVVEDDDAALLGLGLLGVDHGRADDEVDGGVAAQLARHHAESVLVLQQLVSVENWGGGDGTTTVNHSHATYCSCQMTLKMNECARVYVYVCVCVCV